jgi:mannosyltransferase OCH1-like enzyme
MKDMFSRELNGVADIMRYEILYNEGGITLDADSVCLKPLEDWLLAPETFVCWEQELIRPNLIACGTMGSVPKNKFFRECILGLNKKETVINERAWISVGPTHLTNTFRETQYPLTIYPSYFFIKTHYAGIKYEGTGHCFADQFWGSTLGYDNIS